MSYATDFYEQNLTIRKLYWVRELLNPFNYSRTAKYRKQRANRGWADRDTWGMGEHIARLVVEMLSHLRDKGVTDWDAWFDFNIDEKGKGAYKNLQEVIDDISGYLEHEKTSWADDLHCETVIEGYYGQFNKQKWFDEKGKEQTDAALKNRMNKWHKDNTRLYKKATKAMSFFGRNFASFWD